MVWRAGSGIAVTDSLPVAHGSFGADRQRDWCGSGLLPRVTGGSDLAWGIAFDIGCELSTRGGNRSRQSRRVRAVRETCQDPVAKGGRIAPMAKRATILKVTGLRRAFGPNTIIDKFNLE